ncbi:MAG: hypothetical protein GC136_03125 [Alphaproteobacteria bacterium]|nr:hypothetical protein [Alphaproteobacteria bacterium]
MSIKQPTILAVIPLDPKLGPELANAEYLEPAHTEAILAEAKERPYKRLDNLSEATIVTGDNGQRQRLYAWQHPAAPDGDPRGIVALYADIDQQGEQLTVQPESILRGSAAKFIMLYQMSCCTGPIAVLSWQVTNADKSITPKMKILPSRSGTMAAQIGALDGKVYVATNPASHEVLLHALQDVTKVPHDCRSHTRLQYTPSGA